MPLTSCHEEPLKFPVFCQMFGKSASLAFWLEISWLCALENLFSVDSLNQFFGVEASLPGKKTNNKKALPKN